MIRALLLLAWALAAAAPARAARHEYSVVIQQQRAGHVIVDAGDDGRVSVDQSWRDNGRGPDLRERYTLDAQGVPVNYEAEGRAEYGAEIGERFTFEAGRVRWTSRADRGDEAVAPGALFLPLEGSYGYAGALVRALLLRPEGRAPVVGGQQLAIERVATLSVDGPEGPVPLVLVALTGADTSPWYFWHRDDASRRFFAALWPGFAVVARGHEAAVDTLLARTLQAQDAWLAGLQRRAARALPGLTLIRRVRWFDAPAARMRGPADVYLRDGRIAAVTAPGALSAQPAQTIDGLGRTLLPGLFDMHAHLQSDAAPLHLAAGVTSVRDMGGDNDDLLRLQTRLAAHELPGPNLFPTGFIEGESPYATRSGFVVDSLDAGLRAVDWYAARGYRQIKLYNSIRPEWVRPLAARAHRLGLTVAGHVPAFMRAEQAVRAGYDELTHVNQLTLNFLSRPGDDSRTLLRFTRLRDDGHRLDIDGARVRRFVALLRERRTVVDLTLGAFESMLTQRQGEPSAILGPVAEHLPVVWRRRMRVAEMDIEPRHAAGYRATWNRLLALARAMHRAGVVLVAGTDDVPGLALHHELELYVRAGIAPAEVLRIATWNGARVTGSQATHGRIARGHAADLVLVEGDPSRRIADIRRTSLVIRGGVAYSPATLYEAMGFRPLAADARIEPAAATP